MKNIIYIFCLFTFFPTGEILAQDKHIRNFQTKIENDEVIITYDLVGDVQGQVFDVRLYSQLNNYNQRLYRATGDIGRNIKTGSNKEIRWNNKEELTTFDLEDMRFEVSATMTYSPIYFNTPKKNVVLKRAKQHTITWVGGDPTGQMELELHQQNKRVLKIGNTSNSGRYTWEIPSNVKPGEGYRIKIVNPSNTDESTMSPSFVIRRKIPTVYKIVPLGIVAVGAAYLIINNLSSTDEELGELPAPPIPD